MVNSKIDNMLSESKVIEDKSKKALFKSKVYFIISIIIFLIIDWRLAIGLILFKGYVENKIAWVLWDVQSGILKAPLGQAMNLIIKIKKGKDKASEN